MHTYTNNFLYAYTFAHITNKNTFVILFIVFRANWNMKYRKKTKLYLYPLYMEDNHVIYCNDMFANMINKYFVINVVIVILYIL